MREIKFRYGYTDGNDWMFGYFQLEEIENQAHIEFTSDNPFLKRYRLTTKDLYTGLKDKNGVEIYEDDILKCEDEDIEYLLVEWDNHKACFSINYYGYDVYSNENGGEETMNSISCLDSYLLTDSELEITEVIGNIHQHHHLLK